MKKFIYLIINEENYSKIYKYSRNYYFTGFLRIIICSFIYYCLFSNLLKREYYDMSNDNIKLMSFYISFYGGIILYCLIIIFTYITKIIRCEKKFKVFKNKYVFWFIICTYILLILCYSTLRLLYFITNDNLYLIIFNRYLSFHIYAFILLSLFVVVFVLVPIGICLNKYRKKTDGLETNLKK